MRALVLNLFLAFVWVLLVGDFSQANLIAGLVFGYILLFLFKGTLLPETSYFRKSLQVIRFVTFFIWELGKANLKIASVILTPNYHIQPAIIAIPLDIQGELEITLLANLITLTPGTLSLDVSADRQTLYVYAIYVDNVENFRQSIKLGFEQRIKELFQ